MNARQDPRICNVPTIPCQQVLYSMMSNHRDMKCIRSRLFWEYRASHDLLSNVCDCGVERQKRDAVKHFQSLGCE